MGQSFKRHNQEGLFPASDFLRCTVNGSAECASAIVQITSETGVPDLCSDEASVQDSSQQRVPGPGSSFLTLILHSELQGRLRRPLDEGGRFPTVSLSGPAFFHRGCQAGHECLSVSLPHSLSLGNKIKKLEFARLLRFISFWL